MQSVQMAKRLTGQDPSITARELIKICNDLVADMEAGNVGALLIYGANPVYNYYDADKFKAALKKVKLTVSFSERWMKQLNSVNYILPTHHYLESWGDAEPKAGITSFIQPTIYPLFKTRPFQTSLLRWSGNNTDYDTYFKNLLDRQTRI